MTKSDSRDSSPPSRWVWRGAASAVLVFGWLFIAWQNHFHITAPVVVICLGFLAVVATVANLWRTGAAAVTEDDGGVDSTWAKPAGALGELEREKRTLLKAIKEAEFDHQMGKLSQADVDGMVRTYRARAIEVMKEIERLESGTTGTAREQIMREVRARIELEGKARKPDAKARKAAKGSAKLAAEAKPDDHVDADSDANDQTAANAAAESDVEAAADAKAAADAADDEGLDADSTTALEPKRDEPAKEAMR
jgi:hypothetical protein